MDLITMVKEITTQTENLIHDTVNTDETLVDEYYRQNLEDAIFDFLSSLPVDWEKIK